MQRRDFLKSSASLLALGSVSQLMPSLSWALGTQQQYFLSVFIHGGSDVSLGLDPWITEQRPDTEDFFIEYTPNDLVRVGDVIYGPALSNIRNVLSEFSVVRGIFLSESDNGHPAAEAMMRSGSGSGKFPDVAVEFAAMHEEDENFGVVTDDFLFQSDRDMDQFDINNLMTMNLTSTTSDVYPGNGSVSKARENLKRKSELIKNFITLRDQLIQNSPDQRKVASLVAAFKTGITRSASIRLDNVNDLDTHSNHEKEHLSRQSKHWEELSKLVNILKSVPAGDGTSIFDKTTIVVFSEFSRTPALNSAKGKDHNPLTNSVLVSGPGFKKGISIGGSRIVSRKVSSTGHSYHVALPCDLNNGKLITRRADFASGDMITPEIFMATLADSMQLTRSLFGCAKTATKSIRRILK